MPKPDLTSDEKIDFIFRYCRRTYHWAVFRGVISFLFFLIFVVLPVVGGVFAYKYFKTIDWSKFGNIQAQFEEFQDFGSTFQKFGDAFKSSDASDQKPAMPKPAN